MLLLRTHEWMAWGYVTNSWAYDTSLIFRHWILCHTLYFGEDEKMPPKNVTVPLFGESS